MSADNGYIVRVNDEGDFVLQMYFASADKFPPIDEPNSVKSNTLAEALDYHNRNCESEYGLVVDPSCYTVETENPKKNTPHKKEALMIETKQYIRKSYPVDAVQVTDENMHELAAWCQGDIRTVKEAGEDRQYIKVRVHQAKNDKQSMAFSTNWILYTESGYKVFTDRAFKKSFEEVSDDATGETPEQDVKELQDANHGT